MSKISVEDIECLWGILGVNKRKDKCLKHKSYFKNPMTLFSSTPIIWRSNFGYRILFYKFFLFIIVLKNKNKMGLLGAGVKRVKW